MFLKRKRLYRYKLGVGHWVLLINFLKRKRHFGLLSYYSCALNQELKIGFIETIRKRRRLCSWKERDFTDIN